MKGIEVKCTCSTHGRSGEMRTKVWFRKRNRREILADWIESLQARFSQKLPIVMSSAMYFFFFFFFFGYTAPVV
jgi:hypothetical protein